MESARAHAVNAGIVARLVAMDAYFENKIPENPAIATKSINDQTFLRIQGAIMGDRGNSRSTAIRTGHNRANPSSSPAVDVIAARALHCLVSVSAEKVKRARENPEPGRERPRILERDVQARSSTDPFRIQSMTLKLSILAHMAVAAVFDPFNYGVGSGNAPGLEWFKTAKFGMFMHYGPVTQWGTEISFPLVCQSFPCSPAGPNNTKIDIKTSSELAAHRQAYRDLTKTFNPTKFDAAKMASLAKAAGFKYFVYTAVHCDGKCAVLLSALRLLLTELPALFNKVSLIGLQT